MQLGRGLKPHFVCKNCKVALLLTTTKRVGRLKCTCPPFCLASPPSPTLILPETQRTQAIESETWIISAAKKHNKRFSVTSFDNPKLAKLQRMCVHICQRTHFRRMPQKSTQTQKCRKNFKERLENPVRQISIDACVANVWHPPLRRSMHCLPVDPQT